MKLSTRIEACALSPIRKFHPYVVEAEAKGRKVLHLNIGQPDIATPAAFFDAVRNFEEDVLAYAPSAGADVYLKAVRDYYKTLGVELALSDILATFGGSEALQLALTCVLDEGDEILVPEPFYPNYATFTGAIGGDPSHSHQPGGRLPLCQPGAHRAADRTEDPGDSCHEPRQSHRRGADGGGSPSAAGYRQGAGPVPDLRRGLP